MPSDADPLAGSPPGDAGTDGIHDADHLVPGHDRISHPGQASMNTKSVAVADAAGLYLDPDRAGCGFGDIALHDFEWTVGAGDLDDTHFRHTLILSCRSRNSRPRMDANAHDLNKTLL